MLTSERAQVSEQLGRLMEALCKRDHPDAFARDGEFAMLLRELLLIVWKINARCPE